MYDDDHPTGNPTGSDGDTGDTGDDTGSAADEPGRPSDSEKKSSLPPGADTRGDDDEIAGNAGWGTPSEDAPGEGRLAPDGDNPPP
jgi:hypothetical protein